MPFSQLHHSSSLPFRTAPRKEGIRIPNDKPQQFYKRYGLKHFPGSVIETEDLFLVVTLRRTGNDFGLRAGFKYRVIETISTNTIS